MKNKKLLFIFLLLTTLSVLFAVLRSLIQEPVLEKKFPAIALLSQPLLEDAKNPTHSDLRANPFDDNQTPSFSNLPPEHSNPQEWKMIGLLTNQKKTWAIMTTPEDPIFYLSTGLAIQENTVEKIDLEGLTLLNNKTGEKQHIPYQTTDTPTPACNHDDCFSMIVTHISTNRLLEILGQFQDMNIITQPGITSDTSLQLMNITWKQALDIILKTQGLAKWAIDNSYFIGTTDEIVKLEQQSSELDKEQRLATPLITKIINLHYLSAENLLKNLGDNKSLLSKRGHLSADPNKNAILIQDLPEQVANLSTFIQQLDTPSKQVNIQAYVVSIDDHYEQEIGARLHFQPDSATPASNITPSNQLRMDLPNAASDTSNLGLLVFKLSKNILLNLELSALESEGHAEMIASPHLITANQQTAMIESGQEIPYQETSRNGGTTSTFKKAVLKLEVTPQITSPKNILLHIQVNQDEPTQKSVQGMPTIDTRQINTQVLVSSGETIVLGGIYEDSSSDNNDHVPFIGKIPVVGWFFHHQQKMHNRRQLLIFVTPTIAN